jgi:molybdopterin adenylyltransferase
MTRTELTDSVRVILTRLLNKFIATHSQVNFVCTFNCPHHRSHTHQREHYMSIIIGILNVSDRASAGIYEDIPGRACAELLREWLSTPFELDYKIVPDEQALIAAELCRQADVAGCALIVTTGGTGPAPRDVTPEATIAVCEKLLPGFGELMRATSLQYVPTAILSRQTAGIRGKTLIINLPGRPKSIRENLSAVFPAVPYCIDLIGGPRLETNQALMRAFRPASK